MDVLLDEAEEAMKGCSTSLDWEAAIEQLERVRLKAPGELTVEHTDYFHFKVRGFFSNQHSIPRRL